MAKKKGMSERLLDWFIVFVENKLLSFSKIQLSRGGKSSKPLSLDTSQYIIVLQS